MVDGVSDEPVIEDRPLEALAHGDLSPHLSAVLVAVSDETVREVLGRAVRRAGYAAELVGSLRAAIDDSSLGSRVGCVLVDPR